MTKKTQERWRELVVQWQASKKNAKTWCQEHDVPYVSFICWKNRLAKSTAESKADLFLELSDSPSTCSGIKIQLHAITLSLSKDFDSRALVRCIQALEKL